MTSIQHVILSKTVAILAYDSNKINISFNLVSEKALLSFLIWQRKHDILYDILFYR